MIAKFATWWAGFIFRNALSVLLSAALVTFLAIKSMGNLGVSTEIEALMPQGTESVKTLDKALRKTGSFASIQIVASSNSPETTLTFIKAAKQKIDAFDWVQSSQYSEDVSVIEQHKLLLLGLEDLLALEVDINKAYPTIVAQQLSELFGTEITFNLRDENLSGNSNTALNTDRINEIQSQATKQPMTERMFVSEDGLTAVLVIWPKSGLNALADAKQMVDDSTQVVQSLMENKNYSTVTPGVAGRIANKVAQFNAIVGDLKLGLLTAITLISILIAWSYRSLIALPLIFIPLFIGIIWTLGLTAVTVGGLNLITVFLALILFGLGIDFGIHNFSRYREERRNGHQPEAAITTVILETGSASLIAAMTTALAFFALTLTEFRAFTEFGLIAGMGIVLTFISMYSIFPALIVTFEKWGWRADKIATSHVPRMEDNRFLNPLKHKTFVKRAAIALFIFAVVFAPQVKFERNIKNLESKRPDALIVATDAVGKVFSDGHDRAIVVVNTQEELSAINKYFETLIAEDTETPTINKVSSFLDFVPDENEQKERLAVIHRLEKRADDLQSFDSEKYKSSKRYLSIEDISLADLPTALRRTYLGIESEPGYLMYIYNSVSMNDSATARLFYDDAAKFTVNNKTYFSASEGFIFVEMIALMKADATKAIFLVILTTAFLVFLFVRSWRATLVILTPPLFGVFITLGIMGLVGPSLSIMNMVILPSLIGIAVDNSIHIFHRFESEGENANIPQIMNSTGRAAVLTTLTTLIGFGGMVTASMGGLRSMGWLAIIGFLSCLLITWVLLPVLLSNYRKKSPIKRIPNATH